MLAGRHRLTVSLLDRRPLAPTRRKSGSGRWRRTRGLVILTGDGCSVSPAHPQLPSHKHNQVTKPLDRDAAAHGWGSLVGMSIDGVAYNLYRVRRTVHEMLKDRGYLIDQADIDLSEESFKETQGEVPSREQMTILVQKRDDPTEQVYVFWPADPKVGVKPIKR